MKAALAILARVGGREGHAGAGAQRSKPEPPLGSRALQEDEGDDADGAEAEADAKETKRRVLKPPGYKKPPLPRPAKAPAGSPQSEGAAAAAGASGGFKKRRTSGNAGGGGGGGGGEYDEMGMQVALERRTVRDSTRHKVEEGAQERRMAEKVRACEGDCARAWGCVLGCAAVLVPRGM